MNARPQAWLDQARNDLDLARLASSQGFLAQACFFASQAAENHQYPYPDDATPPLERFDRQDAEEAIACAAAVLAQVAAWDNA